MCFGAVYPGCRISSWMKAMEHHNAFSLHLPPRISSSWSDYEGYYNGHANSVLWPLFHYFPSYADYDMKAYDQYNEVNDLFAETLIEKSSCR